MTILVPEPCDDGGGGSGGPDVEQLLLCDTLADGTVVGTALAVYEYDESGNPSGPPTFVIPGTNTPYVVQGTLMACPGATGCLEPVEFCFTTTSTGPVEHPGRQYDLTLPINPGFAVQSMNVDAVSHAANIVWNVDDPDGAAFATELATFIDARVPASATVTITNPNAGTPQVCGTAAPMSIHIECLRLDQNPPALIELIFNAGQDLIQNPAYNESPALNPPVSQGNYGFRLLSRQDDPGPFPGNQPANDALCTTVANRGWETNDVGRTFEIWGQNIRQGEGVVVTPRGTPVQEITSDGAPPGGLSTIWQTFVAPASGPFNIRVVHGARDNGETHRITLTPGDTDATQGPGAIIDNVTNPPQVTTNGGNPASPWTTFNQTIPLVGGQTYTLALSTTNPVGGARGGLFTDMRAFVDVPDERATAVVDDDTCTVTVDETTTSTDAQWWSPLCEDGDITGWKNAETNAVLTNAQFWGQVPAPDRCAGTAADSEGGSVAANLVHTYLICGEVGGVQQTLSRVVITDASGGALAQTIIGPDGAPVVPDSWSPGACADAAFMEDQVLCDDNGPFIRKYVQNIGPTGQPQIQATGNFTLAGASYTPVGTVGVCESGGQTLGPVCWNTLPPGPNSNTGFMTLGENGDPVLYDSTGTEVTDPYVILICPETGVTTQILCDQGNAGHQFLRAFRSSPIVGDSGPYFDLELDGQTAYAFVGPATVCGEAGLDNLSHILCDDNGVQFLRTYSYAAFGGFIGMTNTELDGITPFAPVEPVALCPTASPQLWDVELQILCDSNGTRFLRRYVYDASSPGGFTSILNTTLDGSTPFAPVGAVGICTTPVATDFDFEVIELCDDNGAFLRRFTFNSTTGAVTSTTNTTLAGAAYVPVGTVGICDGCCPVVIGNGCSNTGSGRYVAIRNPNGTVALFDAVSGAAILAANIIPCPDDDVVRTLTAQMRLINDADAAWTPGGDATGTITSVTMTVLSGTADVTDQNGPLTTGLPAGFTATWNVEDDNTLLAPQSIDAVGGQTVVHWTERT